MKQFPMMFPVHARITPGIKHNWKSHTPNLNQDLDISIPPEFDGPGGGLSPEDLYAQALQNCFLATFKVFAEKSKLEFSELDSTATLFVDRNEKGVPWMARFELAITIKGATQKENARRLLEKTSQSCMILNSVKTEKIFSFEVV